VDLPDAVTGDGVDRHWVLCTSTKRTTTQAKAMVKLRGATKFFMTPTPAK
jgi:hypothetical protein